TTPSTRARTSVYWSWSSAKLRSARAWARAASARTTSASFMGTWPRWLTVLARVPRSSTTRCFACRTPCVLDASDASACCTSRSACVFRRSVASCTARAAPSAVSATSKSRSATRPDWTSLRWRSISRVACAALALAPVASAAAAAAAARLASSTACASGQADRPRPPPPPPPFERPLGLVGLRLGHPAGHRELGAGSQQRRLRHRHRGRRLIALGPEIPRVEAQEHLSRLDLLIVLDEELHDVAHDLGAHH